MIFILQRLLRYYDVDIMDSLSYFTHETIDSVDSFIGRGNSSIDSDNSGSNGSNTSNSGNSSNSGDSSQEAEESLSKEYKETVRNASDDDDDPSSTLGPIDREEAKAKISNTSKIKDWYDTIIGLLNWGWDGGGGDTSPGITYLGSVLKSVISKGLKLYSYMDYIPSGLLYTVIGYFLILKLYRFLSWESKNHEYEFDMRWMLPTFTSYRVPYETVKPLHRFKPLHRLKVWTHPPHFMDWVFTFNKCYSIYHLQQIRRALGLHFIRGNAITTSFHCISFVDRGLRTLILRDFVASSVRVSTRIFDPISRKYLYHYFYILIYMGVGAVVWYQTLAGGEGLITPCPTGFDMDISPEFWDPTTIGPGYRKVCYLFRKDLTPTVINTYTNHFLFTDILGLPVQEDLFPTGEGGQRVIAVGTALMIAVLLTTKSLVIPA